MYTQPDYQNERNKVQNDAMLTGLGHLAQVVMSKQRQQQTPMDMLSQIMLLEKLKTMQNENQAQAAFFGGGQGGQSFQTPQFGQLSPQQLMEANARNGIQQQPNAPQAFQQFQQTAPMQSPTGGLVQTGMTVDPIKGSVSMSYGKDKGSDKLAESKAKDVYASEKNLSNTGRFLKQFGRSYEELKKAYPEIGKEGLSGWGTRNFASLQTKLGSHPETKAFLAELRPMANQMARDIEGGKITDQDRKIYEDAFANAIVYPSDANVRLISNALLSLKDKGGDITKVVNELRQSPIDIMGSVVKQIDEDDSEYERFQKILGKK